MDIAYGFVGGESVNAVKILQQPGVINWDVTIKILKCTFLKLECFPHHASQLNTCSI